MSNSSFCWHCGSKLMPYQRDGQKLAYKLWRDPIGNDHRVHHTCFKTLEAEEKKVTARPSEIVVDKYKD